jgi:DNA-binding transcriptional LysR family regulator
MPSASSACPRNGRAPGRNDRQIGGPLLVGASTTIAEFMLPRILGEFKSQYPNVRPRLIVANSESIETRVAEHTLDIGLIEAPSHEPNLQCEVCCDDELLVICAPGFPLAQEQGTDPASCWRRIPSSAASPVPARAKSPTTTSAAPACRRQPEHRHRAGQPGGDQGRGGDRHRLRHRLARLGGQGKAPRRPARHPAQAAPDAHAVDGLSEGEVPLAAGQHLRRVRQRGCKLSSSRRSRADQPGNHGRPTCPARFAPPSTGPRCAAISASCGASMRRGARIWAWSRPMPTATA